MVLTSVGALSFRPDYLGFVALSKEKNGVLQGRVRAPIQNTLRAKQPKVDRKKFTMFSMLQC